MAETGDKFEVKELVKWASTASKIIRKDGSLESLDESDMSNEAKGEKKIILDKIKVC
jgi:hypothetical protein